MAKVPFERLVGIYANTTFDADGERGQLVIASATILRDLLTIDQDAEAGESTNVTIVDDQLVDRAVGDTVTILARAPRIAYGILAKDVDALLRAPRAFIEEPSAYFVIEGNMSSTSTPAPAILTRYHQILALVRLFAKAAAFLDPVKQELVFVENGTMPIPIRYDASALQAMKIADATALVGLFTDDIHEDQRLSILATAILAVCATQQADRRFRIILENLDTLIREVRDGYRLFASEFTYAKIRRDVETAQFDYLGKIHKTFTDIQGQLLGIPVATLVVTAQLKPVHSCGLDYWSDVAVLAGAWVFSVLVAVAIANQWLTLCAISDEIDHQKRTLDSDYAPIADKFADVFTALARRICLHRAGFIVVAAIAFGGAALATFAAYRIVDVSLSTCIWETSPPAPLHPNGAPAPVGVAPAMKGAPVRAPAAGVSPPAPQQPAPAAQGTRTLDRFTVRSEHGAGASVALSRCGLLNGYKSRTDEHV